MLIYEKYTLLFCMLVNYHRYQTSMKYLPFFCCVLLCGLSACKKIPAAEPIDPETLDELWTKLAIPGQQRGVSAIYGNIDDTLVVERSLHIRMRFTGTAIVGNMRYTFLRHAG